MQIPTESEICKAVEKRQAYFRENQETVTMKTARRLLEKDLGAPPKALDEFKGLISRLVEKAISELQDSPLKNHKVTNSPKSKPENVKKSDLILVKKTPTKKRKSSKQTSDPPKARKVAENDSENGSGAESEDADNTKHKSRGGKSSGGPPSTAPVAGTSTRAKKLKLILTQCSIKVGPRIYQGGPSEKEIVERLEALLEKEGLSSNPSSYEINKCKKRLELSRELDGIDMNNVVTSGSRRRAATSHSFFSNPSQSLPTKPKPSKMDISPPPGLQDSDSEDGLTSSSEDEDASDEEMSGSDVEDSVGKKRGGKEISGGKKEPVVKKEQDEEEEEEEDEEKEEDDGEEVEEKEEEEDDEQVQHGHNKESDQEEELKQEENISENIKPLQTAQHEIKKTKNEDSCSLTKIVSCANKGNKIFDDAPKVKTPPVQPTVDSVYDSDESDSKLNEIKPVRRVIASMYDSDESD